MSMIVIRVGVPKRIPKSKALRIKRVIAEAEDGTCYALEILNAYRDVRGQPSVKVARRTRA